MACIAHNKQQDPCKSVKGSVEYVCGVLQSLGIHGLASDDIRRAKFNHPSASNGLLQALHELVVLNLAFFDEPISTSRSSSSKDSRLTSSSVKETEIGAACDGAGIQFDAELRTKARVDSCSQTIQPLTSAFVRNQQKKHQILKKSKLRTEARSSNEQPKLHSSSNNRSSALVSKDGDMRKPNPSSKNHNRLQEVRSDVSQESSDAESLGKKLAFVKFYMALWGYPPHSPFFALGSSTKQSRHLLLALAWLVSHCDAFQRALHQQIQPLLLSRSKAPLPPYPADVSCSDEALMTGRQAENETRAYVSRVLHSLDSLGDVKKRAAGRAQQALILYGKVKSTLKSIHALRHCKGKRIHELNQLQIDLKISHPAGRPFSQYEVHLLRHKDHQLRHSQALEADKLIKDEIYQSEKHENMFWEWMEGVVEKTISVEAGRFQSTDPEEDINLRGVSKEELVPAIHSFQKQLLHRKEEEKSQMQTSSNKSSLEGVELQVPESITAAPHGGSRKWEGATDPQVQEKMDRLSMSNQILSNLLEEPIYVKEQRQDGRSQEAVERTARTAEEEIQRLTTLAVALSRVLAKTRACNRALLHEALEPVLNDENFLLLRL